MDGSLRAFAAAFDLAANPEAEVSEAPVEVTEGKVAGPARLMEDWTRLAARAAALPGPVAEMALAGLRKVADFQDTSYGVEYLDRLAQVQARDSAAQGWVLTREAAKYVANAMSYDDIIRVADLKTRPRRFDRIRKEMRVTDGNVLHLTEFFHPRAEEVVGMFPARLGARIEADPAWMARLTRWFDRGRRLRTDSLRAFVLLHVLGGLKFWRRRTLRHAQEQAHLVRWLEVALAHAGRDYALAVEVIRCRRLIKGYSDTHARGQSKFDRVLEATARISTRADAADWCRRLREAALKDEEGKALDGAIRTIESFA